MMTHPFSNTTSSERAEIIEQQFLHALDLINSTQRIPTETMRAACHIVINDGRDPANCTKANSILSALDAAA